MRVASQAPPAPPVKLSAASQTFRMERFREVHLDPLYAIESRSFGPDSYNRESFAKLCQDNRDLLFVATLCGEVVGYVMGERRSRSAEIVSLAVDREYRGRGLGKKLLLRLLKRLRAEGTVTVFLMVRTDNLVAANLYRDCGFQTLRRVSHYYMDGADALRMKLVWR